MNSHQLLNSQQGFGQLAAPLQRLILGYIDQEELLHLSLLDQLSATDELKSVVAISKFDLSRWLEISPFDKNLFSLIDQLDDQQLQKLMNFICELSGDANKIVKALRHCIDQLNNKEINSAYPRIAICLMKNNIFSEVFTLYLKKYSSNFLPNEVFKSSPAVVQAFLDQDGFISFLIANGQSLSAMQCIRIICDNDAARFNNLISVFLTIQIDDQEKEKFQEILATFLCRLKNFAFLEEAISSGVLSPATRTDGTDVLMQPDSLLIYAAEKYLCASPNEKDICEKIFFNMVNQICSDSSSQNVLLLKNCMIFCVKYYAQNVLENSLQPEFLKLTMNDQGIVASWVIAALDLQKYNVARQLISLGAPLDGLHFYPDFKKLFHDSTDDLSSLRQEFYAQMESSAGNADEKISDPHLKMIKFLERDISSVEEKKILERLRKELKDPSKETLLELFKLNQRSSSSLVENSLFRSGAKSTLPQRLMIVHEYLHEEKKVEPEQRPQF